MTLAEVKITEKLRQVWPKIALGCIRAKVVVEESNGFLWQEIEDHCRVVQQELEIADITGIDEIRDGREAYKKIGKDPGKYRLSVEALFRRVVQGKGVYRINNIVEINNLVSLRSKLPVGAYDVAKLGQGVVLTVGESGGAYQGIGKDRVNIENLPVLQDSLGYFGSPTSDSRRAMITSETKEILMCIYSFSGANHLPEYTAEIQRLLAKYAQGKEMAAEIVI